MKNFEEALKDTGYWMHKCEKYCPAGTALYGDHEDVKGVYWYYETDSFIVDIHDLFVKKEKLFDSIFNFKPYMTLISTYIISGNGEFFNPYQTLSSNSMFVLNVDQPKVRFLIHKNSSFFSVGINFKSKMIDECMIQPMKLNKDKVVDIFFDTKDKIINPIKKISQEILSCTMQEPSAKLFFEAKAKEWMSVIINEYQNIQYEKPLSTTDSIALENVTEYINDHYFIEISQDILEKIAMMSKTKLKNLFKKKYNMSITEYIQRKRMNIAENLLSTTNLEIKDIARSVGYTSHSRFTTLFKKYKGVYPKDIRSIL